MASSHEDQGTGFDPAARAYERQGRRNAPDPTEVAPDANLPPTDAREDFATDPAEQKAPEPASAAPTAASAAKDGPKAPEPTAAAPEAPTAPPAAPEQPFVAYPENHETHPSRLPPAARPVRQGA